ncbi:E3 ubiquitin-protein ligase pub1 [Basidiobolus ranarum]|uniref:E3 ubiquitin-protein ligase pub1 n=1 Tax=Basidiobolus ranarum TaxID=34480 RepID=A0ABR2WPF3_9FUNG
MDPYAASNPALMGMSQDEGFRSLYVGNLDPRVTDYMLWEIFATVGQVISIKIIPDKSFAHGGLNYGFIEFIDHYSADQALQTLNGRKIFNSEIRVNWAFAGANAHKEDTSSHYHVFVGDLSPEVNDQVLAQAFSAFGSMSDARVMWDMNSGKSRGYGFVAFREKADADQAINTMNGEWLGSRAIRCNWANQKGAVTTPTATAAPAAASYKQPMTYETVVAQSPQHNTTIYAGNLAPYTTQEQLYPLFQQYGYIIDVRMQVDRGFAFVKLDTHENAAMAIVSLHGTVVNGRPLKCSWGKDKPTDHTSTPSYPQQAYGYMAPMYSMYQPQAYPAPGGEMTAAAQAGSVDPNAQAAAPGTWDGYAMYDPYAQYYGAYGAPAAYGVPGADPNAAATPPASSHPTPSSNPATPGSGDATTQPTGY